MAKIEGRFGSKNAAYASTKAYGLRAMGFLMLLGCMDKNIFLVVL